MAEFEKYGDEYAMDAKKFADRVGDVQPIEEPDEDGNPVIVGYNLTNQDEFNSIIENLRVIGRATAADKQRLIAGLKGMDDAQHRVGVVGEGLNDVDAFELADVSFALQTGTSIARNSASMVLHSNDFKSVMRAVMWGRNLFMNVQRFLQFQITCNLSVIIVVMVSYCVRQESVLNPVQLIYINLIMDVLGALALASTKPTTDIAHYQSGQGNIMTAAMYRQIFGGTICMVTVMMVIMCADRSLFSLVYNNYDSTIESDAKMTGYTCIFNTFIFLQIFNMVNCRDVSPNKKHGCAGIHRNMLTWVILLVLIAVQIFACFTFLGVPVFETSLFVKTDDQAGRNFAITLVSAASIFVMNALMKCVPVRWVKKIVPRLNENKAIGGKSRLMQAYERHGKAKMLTDQPAKGE